MSDTDAGNANGADPTEDVPTWDDDYVDAVHSRLLHNYDLEKDYRVAGETFPLYGEMVIESEKHFLHPSISIAHHHSTEHLFLRRADVVTEADLDRLVALGHGLAGDWIDPDEEHYSTEFTFVVVAPTIPDAVRSRVASLDERTLLRYGYHGHYEVNLVVVAPDERDIVGNDAADVEDAFRTWEPIERSEPGLLELIARRFQL